jgi:hypothetical protein
LYGKSALKQEEDFHRQIGLEFEEETSEMLHLEHGFFYGTETWTFREVDQKYL